MTFPAPGPIWLEVYEDGERQRVPGEVKVRDDGSILVERVDPTKSHAWIMAAIEAAGRQVDDNHH